MRTAAVPEFTGKAHGFVLSHGLRCFYLDNLGRARSDLRARGGTGLVVMAGWGLRGRTAAVILLCVRSVMSVSRAVDVRGFDGGHPNTFFIDVLQQ